MSLSEVLRTSLDRSVALYDELVAALDESTLIATLPGLRSNTLGGQLWCVIGARESYTRSIQNGAWSGFTCSLTSTDVRNKPAVLNALTESVKGLASALANLESQDDDRSAFVVALLEHEAAHQGQLIRYLYGLDLPIPQGWKAKYALD